MCRKFLRKLVCRARGSVAHHSASSPPPGHLPPSKLGKAGGGRERHMAAKGCRSKNVSMFFSNSIANRKGFLPCLSPFRGWTGAGEAGKYNAPGLPELTGGFSAYCFNDGDPWHAMTSTNSGQNALTVGSSNGTRYTAFTFRASLSNTIYGASSTVMPPSVNLPVCIYLGIPA